MIAILDTNSNVVARYTYDAWGKILSITDASGNAITSSLHIANVNPIRYRGIITIPKQDGIISTAATMIRR